MVLSCMNLPACSWGWLITTDPVFNLTLLFLAWASDLTRLCVTKAFIKLRALFCFYSLEGNKMCFLTLRKWFLDQNILKFTGKSDLDFLLVKERRRPLIN